MKKLELTLSQKRFLIAWILLNSFALFVNLAYLRGEVNTSGDSTLYLFTSGDNSGFWPFASYYSAELKTVKSPTLGDYLPYKTDSSAKKYLKPEDALKRAASSDPNKSMLPTDNKVTDGSIVEQVVGVSHSYYGGLFNSYGITEYIFYMCLGFAVIFLPKLWK